MNNFIIEHTTDTKIRLIVPLDHRDIFQANWANLKTLDLI
jgi:DNA-binding transcriptional regulator/RsmH inhibitor MraZ